MKKNFQTEEGQALIELIIFLPLMFTVYFLVNGFANAIYGSINQQKFTRGYFYYRAQNNSVIPKPEFYGPQYTKWSQFGMFFLGWKQRFDGDGTSPLMTCYRVSIPMQSQRSEKCDDSYSGDTSQYIKVATVYGICGATYVNASNQIIMLPNGQGSPRQVTDKASCLIR